MSITIQKPSKGRVVHFHTSTQRELSDSDKQQGIEKVWRLDVWPGIVTDVHDAGRIDIKTFGPSSIYDNHNVPYSSDGAPGTWRYPPHEKETIEVEG
jgi:hypothetical protein